MTIFKIRHIFGSLRNARGNFRNARKGGVIAPFSRNYAQYLAALKNSITHSALFLLLSEISYFPLSTLAESAF